MPKGEHLIGKGGPKKFGNGVPTNLGGPKKKPKFLDFIKEAELNDGQIIFDADKCEVLPDGRVKVLMPTDQIIAYNLVKRAASNDPRFMDMYLKATNGYAPKQVENRQIDENGETISPPVIVFKQDAKEILKKVDRAK